jgi:hypothetical protein
MKCRSVNRNTLKVLTLSLIGRRKLESGINYLVPAQTGNIIKLV